MDTELDITTTDVMRTGSLAEFIGQANLARAALQQFAAIKDFENADEVKRAALNKLIKHTVCTFYFIVFQFLTST